MVNLSWYQCHYDDVIMSALASQITSLTIVYSTVYPDADLSKHQSSASLAFVWGIHRGPVNSTHKWPVTRKMFPFDDLIMVFSGAQNLTATSSLASSTAWRHRGPISNRSHWRLGQSTLVKGINKWKWRGQLPDLSAHPSNASARLKKWQRIITLKTDDC